MEETTVDAILLRFKDALGAKNDTEIGQALGVTQQAISNARNKKKIPDRWFRKAAEQYNICTEWLLTEKGPKFSSDPVQEENSVSQLPLSPGCAMLERLLQQERMERIEVNGENRKLWVKNEELLRENGELKAEIAQLKERLRAVNRGGEEYRKPGEPDVASR